MNKAIIFVAGLLLMSLGKLEAQEAAPDTTHQAVVTDSGKLSQDTPVQPKDTTAAINDAKDISSKDISSKDTASKDNTIVRTSGNTTVKVKINTDGHKDSTGMQPNDNTALNSNGGANANAGPDTNAGDPATKPAGDAKMPEDSTAKEDNTRGKTDTRWFISPLLKFQAQDFAMLEKNRKGYLSDANTLPIDRRGNASFAASAYKNLVGRLSVSADIGLSFGHVTNDNVLISQTKSRTYNLLNAALYYHLLSASYRLQPYVTVGINDIINDASYVSAPVGIGAKFSAKKIMVLGQITYGYAVSKSVSNTTMYALGVYLPIKNKKQKQQEKEDNSPYNRESKKKDTTGKGNSVNNIFITINMDSVMKARGLSNDDGAGLSGRRKGSGDGSDDGDDDGGGTGAGHKGKHRGLRSDLNLDEDFSTEDYKVDTINGLPVVRFVIYFEFNEYALNSRAFATIDKVMDHLRRKPNLTIEIKGYTDDVGSDQYNNFLSRRRAKMVLEYMNSRGIPSDYMKAKAYGSDDPVADNKDPNQAWLNRRAEIIVHEK